MVKTKQNRKRKIPHTVLERRIYLYFSSYNSRKLKVKLWWDGARERKKKAYFVPFILSEGNVFNICALPQCIVYWIHFQNIHTFTYQKTLLHTLFCMFLKSSKAFSISLRQSQKYDKCCGCVSKTVKCLGDILFNIDIMDLYLLPCFCILFKRKFSLKVWERYFPTDVSIFSEWLFKLLNNNCWKNIFPLIFELPIAWTWLTLHFLVFREFYILITYWQWKTADVSKNITWKVVKRIIIFANNNRIAFQWGAIDPNWADGSKIRIIQRLGDEKADVTKKFQLYPADPPQARKFLQNCLKKCKTKF